MKDGVNIFLTLFTKSYKIAMLAYQHRLCAFRIYGGVDFAQKTAVFGRGGFCFYGSVVIPRP